jgi:hypothetical protein
MSERVAGVIDGVVSELAGLVVDPAVFGRVGATAGLGEDLTVRSTAIASAVPSSISARM